MLKSGRIYLAARPMAWPKNAFPPVSYSQVRRAISYAFGKTFLTESKVDSSCFMDAVLIAVGRGGLLDAG